MTEPTRAEAGSIIEPTPKPRRRFWPVILIVFASIAITVVVLFTMLRSAPSYWQPPNVSDPAVVLAGEVLESRVVSEAHAVRNAEESWTIELTEEQINSWLASRLPRWLANQGADRSDLQAVPHAMVHLNEGRVELALQLRLKGIDQIVRLGYTARAVAGEPVRLELDGVYAGRLRVPLEMLVTQIQKRIGGNDAEDAAEAVAALRHIEMKMKLEDGRTVAATGAELHPGRAVFICQTRLRR